MRPAGHVVPGHPASRPVLSLPLCVHRHAAADQATMSRPVSPTRCAYEVGGERTRLCPPSLFLLVSVSGCPCLSLLSASVPQRVEHVLSLSLPALPLRSRLNEGRDLALFLSTYRAF